MEIENEPQERNFLRDYKGVLVAAVALAVLGIVLLVNLVFSGKEMAIIPGEPTFKAGDPYVVKWSARNIGRVGIVLFNGEKAQWVVQNFDAKKGKYEWQTDPYQAAGTDYRLAVFAYPWKKGNPIAYSPTALTIVGQKYVSCDDYSVSQSWPFLVDSYAGLHRIFITAATFSGNLGGFEGADAICAKEAEKNGYSGKYVAFLGSDEQSAAERISKDGVFVEAEPAGTLSQGKGCNRMVARNVQDLLEKIKLNKTAGKIELSDTFYKRLGDIWLGRPASLTNDKCLLMPQIKGMGNYSGTFTCQNWTVEKHQVYSGQIPANASLTKCYDTDGKNLFANYLGAMANIINESGDYATIGESCDNRHRVMCVEQ